MARAAAPADADLLGLTPANSLAMSISISQVIKIVPPSHPN